MYPNEEMLNEVYDLMSLGDWLMFAFEKHFPKELVVNNLEANIS